jgi:hypothetical protein
MDGIHYLDAISSGLANQRAPEGKAGVVYPALRIVHGPKISAGMPER